MAETTHERPAMTRGHAWSWRAVRERLMRLPAVARTVQTVIVVAAGLRNEPITLRAAALTYLTVLSLVPLLAVVFSIFEAVVGTHELQARLQEFVFQNLAVGVQDNVSRYIAQYIQRATSFGLVGFGLLVFSSVSLMANVEAAMNHIFRAPKPRALALRFGVYWCLLTVGPILLALSLAATALLQAKQLEWLGPVRQGMFVLLPGLITIGAFALMYAIVPAVPVKRRAAITGAVIAGVAWEIAKIVYAAVSARSVRTGAIYGSVSAIPIFLVWTYVSWIIVLFGARVAYAVHAGYLAVGAPVVTTPFGRELFGARVMRAIALRFQAGQRPPSAHAVALALQSPETEVIAALHRLHEAGLAHQVAEGGWVPARPLAGITLAEVRVAVREAEAVTSQAPDLQLLRRQWEPADAAADQLLSTTLGELVTGAAAGAGPRFEDEGS